MSEEDIFEIISSSLAEHVALDGPQVRGAIRLALRDAGLAPNRMTRVAASRILRELIPARLVAQGVPAEAAERACAAATRAIDTVKDSTLQDGPFAMFNRLDGLE